MLIQSGDIGLLKKIMKHLAFSLILCNNLLLHFNQGFMGNEAPQSRQKFLERKLDPNYGEVTLFHDKALMRIYAEFKIVVPQDIDSDKVRSQLDKRKKLSHEALLKLIKYEQSSVNDLCSSFNLLSITVEYFNNTLLEDSKQRRLHKTTYNEAELLYLIYTISDFLQYMSEQGIEICDIHPQRILIDDERHVRVFDKSLEKDCLSNYFRVLFGFRDLEYVAPEQLELLEKATRSDTTNQEQVNIFCLGLLIIQLLSGVRCTEYYNTETMTFKLEHVEFILNEQTLKYSVSSSTKQLIQQMISTVPKARPTYVQILQRLSDLKSSLAPHLNPPGMQQALLDSTVTFLSTMRKEEFNTQSVQMQNSPSQSLQYDQGPIPQDYFDYSAIDRILRQSRQNAQASLDECDYQMKLSDYPPRQFNIVDSQ